MMKQYPRNLMFSRLLYIVDKTSSRHFVVYHSTFMMLRSRNGVEIRYPVKVNKLEINIFCASWSLHFRKCWFVLELLNRRLTRRDEPASNFLIISRLHFTRAYSWASVGICTDSVKLSSSREGARVEESWPRFPNQSALYAESRNMSFDFSWIKFFTASTFSSVTAVVGRPLLLFILESKTTALELAIPVVDGCFWRSFIRQSQLKSIKWLIKF